MTELANPDGGGRRPSRRKPARGRKQATEPVRSKRGLVPVDRNGNPYRFTESDCAAKSRVAVALSRDEIRILAQHHWDAGYEIAEVVAGNGGCGSSDMHRMCYYEDRCVEFVDQLPEQDRKQFEQMWEERNTHLEALADEADDCDW